MLGVETAVPARRRGDGARSGRAPGQLAGLDQDVQAAVLDREADPVPRADGAAVSEARSLTLLAREPAELLVFDLA